MGPFWANTRPRCDQRAAVQPGTPDLNTSRALRAAAAARREAALAEIAELDLAERKGQVLDIDQVRADVIAKFSMVKTRLLGVPSRARQRDPSLTGRQVAMVDELIREALEELAAGADRGAHAEGES